jgi:hypothetical protein
MKPTRLSVVAFVVLASCGGDADKAVRAQKTAESVGVVPKSLAGTWTRTVKLAEADRAGVPAGLYTMRLHDTTLELWHGEDADPTRDCLTQEWCDVFEIEAHGQTLTISETAICAMTGDYSFEVSGDTLTTTKVADECQAGRAVIFDGKTWTHQTE